MKNFDALPLYDKLLHKIYAYCNTIWKDKWKEGIEQEWLNNFQDSDKDLESKERLNMLYLLSKFMYFGNEEIRQLLISLYRDLFRYPIIEQIRRSNGDTTDANFISQRFERQVELTRFVGIGNPSESGSHLLFYLRQITGLSVENFISQNTVLTSDHQLSEKQIQRYVFVDDFCVSGTKAISYLMHLIYGMRKANPNLEIKYFMLFGTEYAVQRLRNTNLFSEVDAVFSIDDTFKVFSSQSRYFIEKFDGSIDKDFCIATVRKYPVFPVPPFGYKDSQLLIGLFHNTPDNTLPIFWSDAHKWKPIFIRYKKIAS